MALRRAIASASRSLSKLLIDGEAQMLSLRRFANIVEHPTFSMVPSFDDRLIRAFGTTRMAPSSSLSEILGSEIDYERENYARPEELASGPPPPFTLTESPGDAILTLNSTHGDEAIEIDIAVDDQPAEEPFETEEGVLDVDAGVVFTVTISKENRDENLVFEVKSDGTYMQVLHVNMEPIDEDTDDTIYSGPPFDDLDSSLQQELENYLKARGITKELGAYLTRLAQDKEQRCYVEFLERMHKFIQ